MSQGEKWTVAGVVAAVIGLVIGIAAIVVAHADATDGRNSANAAPPGVTASAPAAVAPSTPPPSHASVSASDSATAVPSSDSPASQSATPVTTHTYSDVSVKPLCGSGDCSGTQQVGDTIFSYTDQAEACYYPQYCEYKAFQDVPTSCGTITVKFSGDDWAQHSSPNTVDYLKFVQQTMPPVYAQVSMGNIATVQVRLDGGPLYVDASVTNEGGVHNDYVLMNVTGTCSTPDGVQPQGQ